MTRTVLTSRLVGKPSLLIRLVTGVLAHYSSSYQMSDKFLALLCEDAELLSALQRLAFAAMQKGGATVSVCDDAEGCCQGVAVRCVDVMFAHTHLPCAIGDIVRDVARQYGMEAAVEVADAVLQAFEAGRAWGVQEVVSIRQKDEHHA